MINLFEGYIKDIRSKQRYHSTNELKAAVITAFGTIATVYVEKNVSLNVALHSITQRE